MLVSNAVPLLRHLHLIHSLEIRQQELLVAFQTSSIRV